MEGKSHWKRKEHKPTCPPCFFKEKLRVDKTKTLLLS